MDFAGVSVMILEDFYRTWLPIILRGFLHSFHRDSKGFSKELLYGFYMGFYVESLGKQ